MNGSIRFALAGAAALGVLAASFALTPSEPPTDEPPQLPPGWTMDDMMAYAEAGTPGKMHAHLAKGVGEWTAKTTMWMMPDADPIVSDGSCTVTPLMDGRFVQVQMKGEMPGMGPYHGMGIYGFNNVSGKFESIWIDNHSTNMMRGVGELDDDGSTIIWEFTYSCPITRGPCVMREIERITGENTKTLEMHGTDPKSGVEYKMMEIEFTRTSGDSPAHSAR